MPLQVPVTQTGLEASIQAAAKKAGRNLRIDLGTNTKSIDALSRPLGRITGQADEFTKSMEAANARVFAFGASVGIINSVTQAFSSLVKNTIAVEKSLTEISTVLSDTSMSLEEFGGKLFDVAKNTGQTFDVVSKGALELARQGLDTEKTLKRISDAMILSRLSGLDAQQSVEGLTAAFNSFKETGITTSEILNKLVVVSQKYAVSERDLIEGIKRSASVADQAGVSFDELAALITAVQERTARGGAVIGNAFKTIFARIQDTGAIQSLDDLGVTVVDVENKILPATKILENLAAKYKDLSQLERSDIAKKLGGVYQLSNLLAALKDLSQEQSTFSKAQKDSLSASDEAYKKNAVYNQTLASLINKTTLSAQELGATLGEIGISNSLKGVINFFNGILEGIQNILSEKSALGDLFEGITKGIGGVLAGPGFILFGAIILKLSKDLALFGFSSLKSFFKIGEAAREIQTLQGSIASTLLKNKDIQKQILGLEGDRAAQAKYFTTALNEQYAVMQKMQGIASSVAPIVYAGTSKNKKDTTGNAASGYMPAVSQESRNISRGVGGARGGDKPVVIPNFAFGGGKKGTMVAHTGEFIVPNFAAGGSAIFNRDMVRSMGLPAGAKKIGAAGGFIPNFAEWYNRDTTKVKTSTSMPTTPGDWIKVKSSSESIRKYSENIDQYRVRDTDFYLFPDGTGSRGNTVRDTLSREESKAVTNIKQQKQKISEAGEFEINANALGGIAVVSPRFGSGVRELSATGLIANYAAFNQGGPNANIDKNKYITLKGIKGVNTPKPQDVKGLSVDINQLFADRIVDLAYKLYGGTFDSASAGEFGQKLKSLSGKRALLPPTAEGQIFEAAGKVALNSIENLESLFGSEEQNRPFDFQNPKAIQQMFGLNVLRGDAKRGGEDKFVDKDGKMAVSSKGQDMIRKSLNDPEYSSKMLSILKSQGAFSPEMQRKKSNEEVSNAINGFIPNFVDETLQKEISKKSGSDLYLKDGVLKVGFLRSRDGNPLFEIARLINENKIKEINAGAIIGPKIPDLIVGLRKMIERKRLKDPSFPRIKITGHFRPQKLAEKISEQSEYKYKQKHGDLLKYYTKGYDYYGRKDQKNFVSAMGQMKLNRKDDSFVDLQELYPQGFAQGYIPNFADPLKEAIGREMSAGVPASQIYVDQNSSLKNSMNPMGLMVANRRDEPGGGMQGVSRARKEGANPMMYGAADGFIPNYAENVDISEYVGKTRSTALLDESRKYGAELAKLTSEIGQLTRQYGALRNKNSAKGAALEAEIQALTENKNTLKQQSDATRKAITEQSKGVLGTGKTVLGKEAKVSPTNESSRDIIGKIFALQVGLSFLTAATADATSGLVKAGNALADSVSAATNVKFAFEGLSGLAPEGSKVSKVLGQLGTYGAIAAGAFEGFKQLASYLDSTNPSIKKTQSAMEGVADAASKASINLENLKPSERKDIEERRTKFFEEQGISQGFMANFKDVIKATATGGDIQSIFGRVEFEGFGSASRENFTNIIDQASAVGISFDDLSKKLKTLKEGGVITGDEIKKLGFELETTTKQIAELTPENIIKKLGLTPDQGLGQTMATLLPEEMDDFIRSRGKFENGGAKPIQNLLWDKGMKDDSARYRKIKEVQKAVTDYQEQEKEQEIVRVQTASLAVLQQQVENRMAYKNALFEATSAEEYSLELQKEMLSVGEKDRVAAGYKLQALQEAKKLTLEQEKATVGALKDSDLIKKKLESAGTGGRIEPEKFEKLGKVAEKVSDLIKQQGGYTDDVASKTEGLVSQLGLNAEQQKIILDTIKETNGQIEKTLALESRLNALDSLRAATLEAEKFVYEKRSAAITNEYDQASKKAALDKNALDIALERFKVEKERQKIGGGAGGNLSIDKQILEKEKFTINAKLKIDQEDLLNQLRKTLSEAAMQAGFKPEDVSAISTLESKGDFEEIATIIEDAEKEAQKLKIDQALQEVNLKNLSVLNQVTLTQASASNFASTVIQAGQQVASYIKNITPKTEGLPGLEPKIPSMMPLPGMPKVDPAIEEGKQAIRAMEKAYAENAQIQKDGIDASSRNFTGLFDVISNSFTEISQAGDMAVNSIGSLENALLSSGASLTTFANLVRGVFTSLPETIAQNKFAMLTATDSQSIIGNAVEARRNAILAQGPASAGTIAQAADATAIYEKELEIKRAITAEDKINGEFELEKLKEILPLRMELLKAETNEEREAIIDRIIAKEKQRLPVLDRIKAAISSTAEQRTAELEDTLVSASVKFRDNLIDGISQAIEGGGSIKDILTSAALDFAREMTKASMKNFVGSIGGFFGFANGGIVPNMASGGMINGGSGSKDDVPAMLMGGEYVVNKKAVQKYGPEFLNAINNGRLNGYANGGKVSEYQDLYNAGQTGEGGFISPGLYGSANIVGKENLLAFATQSYTSGSRDKIYAGENYASVDFEPESLRMTQFGRLNNVLFQATQKDKETAFGQYQQQLNQEADIAEQVQQRKDEIKQREKALRRQLLTQAIIMVATAGVQAAANGFQAGWSEAGAVDGATLGSKFAGGFKGIVVGGNIEGVQTGGLQNLFTGVGKGLTGNFAEARNYFKLSQIGSAQELQKAYANQGNFSKFLENSGYIPKASIVNENGIGVNGGGGGGGIFDWARNLFGKGSNKDSAEFEATGQDIQPSLWERLTGRRNTIDPYQLIKEDEMAELRNDPVYGYMYQGAQDPRTWSRKRATGGTIPETSGIDTVPTMLSGGEFIMNRAASQNIGAGNLQALNAGANSLPTEEKTEELNDKLISKLDELIKTTADQTGNINITVNSDGSNNQQESGEDMSKSKAQLAKAIKDTVLKVIQDEKRRGGILRN